MDDDEFTGYVEFVEKLLIKNLVITQAERELEIEIRKLPVFETLRDLIAERDVLFDEADRFFDERNSPPDKDEDYAAVAEAVANLGPEYEDVANDARASLEQQYQQLAQFEAMDAEARGVDASSN